MDAAVTWMSCRHCRDEVIWNDDLEWWEHRRRGPERWRCASVDRLAEPSPAELDSAVALSAERHRGK
jgi:hypothetical protein